MMEEEGRGRGRMDASVSLPFLPALVIYISLPVPGDCRVESCELLSG